MDRKSIWSVGNFDAFFSPAIILFAVGMFLRFYGPYEWSGSFALVGDFTSVIAFAITTAFFFVEGGGLVMGFAYEAFARRRFEKGRKEGIRERDEKYAAWIAEERKKGSQGFKEDPPFLKNGNEN
ncbi:MAG: hypothetical protein OXU79_17230 [Gemmatimonadota bacterium]|nr:hypothetical protein [Gemmatimonadota bacterium]